jgi:hypothetical protein
MDFLIKSASFSRHFMQFICILFVFMAKIYHKKQ